MTNLIKLIQEGKYTLCEECTDSECDQTYHPVELTPLGPTPLTAHPSGVTCSEVAQWLPFNLGMAWSLVWNGEYVAAAESISHEIALREACTTEAILRDVFAPDHVQDMAGKVVKAEENPDKAVYFAVLWKAHLSPNQCDPLIRLKEELCAGV